MSATPMTGMNDDLSALAWVVGEVRRSLDTAQKALRRYLREAETVGAADLAGIDPAVLRTVRTQIHQSVGALELVGLGVAAQPLRAAEAAMQRLSARPSLITPAAVQSIEQGIFALLDYLSRTLAGKPVSPLSMFPQYRALQELAGATRAHPADLWPHEWHWHAIPSDPSVPPRAADGASVGLFETEMLSIMRGRSGAAARLGSLCAGLAAGSSGNLATLWQLAAAFMEALADGLLGFDVHAKRAASRLLAQLRAGADGQAADRLAQDLLFFCSQAGPQDDRPTGPRLGAVRSTYGLDTNAAVDYKSPTLGLFDPALVALARRRVSAAKEVWSAVAGGETNRLAGLGEPFALVGESLDRLYPSGKALAQSLQAAMTQCQERGAEPPAALAMEVATSLLYLEASLEDGEFDHPEIAGRIGRLAQRIDVVRQGRDPGALERWMEELYRRVSDRQTMGNVVQELRASLSEVEKQIDQYFRDPAQRELLIPVPAKLSAMRGVLSLLDMDQASLAVLRMRDDVDALANTEVDPERAIQAGTFDHLADNLGALSFLIDMVSVQPQMARSLFRFDAQTGELRASMARAERRSGFSSLDGGDTEQQTLVDQAQWIAMAAPLPRAAGADAIAPVRRETAQSIGDFAGPSAARWDEAGAPPRPVPPPAAAAAAGQTGLEDDAEMRDIFLEEAREVTASARQGLVELRDRPDDLSAMTVVRRAFHTLKGSSRMVGLRDFGAAAWACEQIYNARLADSTPVDADLRGFSNEVLAHLEAWVDAIEAGDIGLFQSEPVIRSADAMRQRNQWLPLVAPQVEPLLEPAAAADEPVIALIDLPQAESLQARVVDLPSAADLDLPELPALQPSQIDVAVPAEPEPMTAIEPQPADDFEWPPEISTVAAPLEPVDLSLPDIEFELDLPPSLAATETLAADLMDLQALAPQEDDLLPLVAPTQADDVLQDMDFDAAEFELDLPARVPAVDAAATPAEPIRLPEISWDLDVGELLPLPETREGPAVPLDEGESVPDQPAPQTAAVEDEEPVKIIGDLRVGIPLFNIYLNEADELSRRLVTELAEWSLELYRPAGDSAVVLAHSLAGSSATVGFLGLSQLARSLEHALTRSNDRPPGAASEVEVFSHAAEEIRRLLHQFAAGFLREPDADLIRRLVELEHAPIPLAQETADLFETEEEAFFAQADPGEVETAASDLAAAESVAPELPPAAVEEVFEQLGQPALMPFAALTDAAQRPSPARAGAPGLDDDIDAVDALDAELFPIFDDEANDLVPQLHARLREWAGQPNQAVAASACLRTLHTLKGGARLAGAMRLGEMAHRIEGAIEQLLARSEVDATDVHRLVAYADSLEAHLESLRQGDSAAPPPPPPPSIEWVNAVDASPPTVAVVPVDGQAQDADALADAKSKRSGLPPSAAPPTPAPFASAMIDWSLFLGDASAAERAAPRVASALSSSTAAVRVRAPLLDRLVNHAGEVSITRARIEADVDQMKDSLRDLDENLGRLRHQLRDIELQAEIQIGTRLEAARAAALEFDPLEMDRFTRFQEITRMMAESVSDVATVQRGLQRTLQSTEDELARQARLTRDLQDDLLRTRMVEFDGLSERLYRVVRQAAKETGKQVRLDITGGSIEIDRGVLDRVTGAFEHVLRNSVVHGIEPTAERIAAGKEAIGTIAIAVTQEGNEVAIDFRDDGAGLALQRIRDKAIALGLLDAQADVGEAELAALIFHSGLTTVDEVTDLAGRGVGMDVVRADVSAMGGRIETATASGQGTSVKLVLPLTTAVTQVVMMRCGDLIVAVPSTLVEIVRRVPAAELPGLYAHGVYRHGDAELPFYWLASLLQGSSFGSATGRTVALVVIRSAAQRIAVHVDEVLRNQEVVVKNLGPQLARLPGLAGMTLLPSGAPALIYNPVALATLYGRASRGATLAALAAANQVSRLAHEAAVVPQAPLVMVVDDSLTVRRVTQRLLVREGYRVVVAKDGLEGLQRLGEELPALVLTDIEMPRMDGFDLVRNMRVDPRLAGLPVIMITSRIAQKHRDYAAELGVEHYLGKPYVEQDLLALVEHYTAKAAV